MRITQTAANDIKKAYMQLQHEFPDVTLSFEPMPDPKTCGKKREGFFNYQQQLNDWKDIAMTQIANAREKTTADGFDAVIRNDNQNAADINFYTGSVAASVMQNENENFDILYRQGESIKSDVHSEGARTRSAVHSEGEATRDTVHFESAITRSAVHSEGEITRDTVKDTAKQTQELDGISEKISVNISDGHTQETMDRVNNMRNRILQSNMSYEDKKEALKHLASFSGQAFMSDKELEAEEKRINKKIALNRPKPSNFF